MKRTLITGGCGLIGSETARLLAAGGCEVCVYDAFLNFVPAAESAYRFMLDRRMRGLTGEARIEKGDVRDRQRLAQVFGDFRPECVVHLAAMAGAREASARPAEAADINVGGTLSVLEACRAVGSVRKFVFASSSFVYGHFKSDPADETHPTEPIDAYGGAKLAGEVLVRAYSASGAFAHSILRPSAVYGYGDANRRVTQIIVENAMLGRPVVLHDGGCAKLDFTHVTDAAAGIVLAVERPEAEGQTFNLTRGRARSVAEFAEAVRRHFPQVQIVSKPPDMVRPRRGTLSIDKARRLLGYDPKVDIEEGVDLYVAAAREHGIGGPSPVGSA